MEEVTVQSKTLEKFELQNSDFGKVHGQYLSAVTDPAVPVLMNVIDQYLRYTSSEIEGIIRENRHARDFFLSKFMLCPNSFLCH